MTLRSVVSIQFLFNAIVYSSEYLARCAPVLRLNVSIDSSAARALSGLVHITSSAESIIRPASLLPQEDNIIAATTATTSLMNILNSLTIQINAP